VTVYRLLTITGGGETGVHETMGNKFVALWRVKPTKVAGQESTVLVRERLSESAGAGVRTRANPMASSTRSSTPRTGDTPGTKYASCTCGFWLAAQSWKSTCC